MTTKDVFIDPNTRQGIIVVDVMLLKRMMDDHNHKKSYWVMHIFIILQKHDPGFSRIGENDRNDKRVTSFTHCVPIRALPKTEFASLFMVSVPSLSRNDGRS